MTSQQHFSVLEVVKGRPLAAIMRFTALIAVALCMAAAVSASASSTDDDWPFPGPHHGRHHWGPAHGGWPHPWGWDKHPPAGYRDVDYFNLLEFIPPAARDTFCESEFPHVLNADLRPLRRAASAAWAQRALATDPPILHPLAWLVGSDWPSWQLADSCFHCAFSFAAAADPFGCPNLALIQSIKFKSNVSAGTTKSDLTAVAMSTLGIPAFSLAHFDNHASFDFNWWTNPMGIIEALLSGGFDSAFSFKSAGFGMAMGFDSIIEYEPANASAPAYAPGDHVYSEYKLHDAKWGALMGYNTTTADNNTIFTLNVTTLDNVFSLQFQTAPAPHTLKKGVVLNPNATKIDVRIQDYPLKGPSGSSRLALRTFVASGNASASVEAKASDEVSVGGGEGYLKWVQSVDVVGKAGPGTASVGVNIDTATSGELGNFANSVAKEVISASGHASGTAKVAYFSFLEDAPSYVYWDPSFGYGAPPPAGPSGPTGGLTGGEWAAIIVGAIAGVALLVFGIVYLRRRSATPAERQPLTADNPA